MKAHEFELIFEYIVGRSREVLVAKRGEYAADDNVFSNFEAAAGLLRSSQPEALWGMLVKHIVSINDMVQSQDYYPPEVWDEKIGDSINYLILLRAMMADVDPENSPERIADMDRKIQTYLPPADQSDQTID